MAPILTSLLLHAKSRIRTLRRSHRASRATARRVALGTAPVIAVTGSAGKTTTVKLLAHLLGGPPGVGVALYANTAHNVLGQFDRMGAGTTAVVIEASEFPPGNLERTATTLRPTVAVLTISGLDHYTAFRGRAAAAREMAVLARHVAKDGFVVMNADDADLRDAVTDAAGPLVTFGRHANADYRATDLATGPGHGLVVTCVARGEPIRLETPFLGPHFAVPTLAAAAAAHRLGVPWPLIQRRLADFEPVFGRCTLHAIPQGPTFICDTTKSPAWSLAASIDTLESFAAAPRRTIVLGTLSDYPGSSRGAYRKAWALARDRADRVIFLRHSPSHVGATADDVAGGRAVFLPTAERIAAHLRSTAIPAEVILLKGSCPADHLDRLAHDFLAPVSCWLDKCGRNMNCLNCEWMRDRTPVRLRPLKALYHKAAGRRRING